MYTDEDYKELKSVILFWKCILTNPRRPGTIFCSSLFQILKKAYL